MCDARPQLDHRHHRSRRIGSELPWQIDVAVAPRETRRRNSHHRVALMGQLNGLTYDAGVGVVMALPELVSEDGDRLGILPFRSISGKNSAAEQSGNAEMSECVSREVDRSQGLGEISSGCR